MNESTKYAKDCHHMTLTKGHLLLKIYEEEVILFS